MIDLKDSSLIDFSILFHLMLSIRGLAFEAHLFFGLFPLSISKGRLFLYREVFIRPSSQI